MKKKVIIIRFGNQKPLPKEFPIFEEIGMEYGGGCSFAAGIISLFMTTKTPDEIVEMYRKVAEETDDQLPVIVEYFDPIKHASLVESPVFFPELKKMNTMFDSAYGSAETRTKECTLSLDELLDLVSAKGIKGLTSDEYKRLQELSK
jgi:hypothetical protein